MISVVWLITILYWCIDFWTLTKYLDQVKSIWRTKKVVGSARKYFVKALVREFAFCIYCVLVIGWNWVLLSLAVLAFIMNLIILVLMIKYKRVYKKKNWEDRVYDWIKIKLLRRIYV